MEWFWWFRYKGTVIRHVWWSVLLFMVYALVIVVVYKYAELNISFGQTLIPVIGLVVGLLLGFRTNSANGRYEEGRKQWAGMTKNIRTMVITIWVSVNGTEAKDKVMKKSAINLCLAFAIAVKHYLREEYSYNFDDLKDLVAHLGKPPQPAQNDATTVSVEPTQQERRVKSPDKLLAYDVFTPTNIPLQVVIALNSYADYVAQNSLAPMPSIITLMGGIGSFLDSLTSFERILRTPIPLAYNLHLHHFVWLYLLAVPFQFVKTLEFWTILITGIGAFCMLGVLSIAYEIENPFGYEDNDLPLDDFCRVLKRELEMITGHPAPDADSWIHSPLNRPFKFASLCDLNAQELSEKTAEEVQQILTDNAKLLRLSIKRK